MAISETDVQRIQQWCDSLVPEEHRDEMRIEADVTPRHVTIVEVAPAPDASGESVRTPVARLRFTRTRDEWSLYWLDRNLEFHEYETAPTSDVGELLAALEEDKHGIFWG